MGTSSCGISRPSHAAGCEPSSPSQRNWKFESIPLQQTVRLSPDFAFVPRKARVFRQFEDYAGRRGRQRRSKPHNIEPTSGSVSVELYSSTAVLLDAVREIGGAGRKRRRSPGVNDLGGALSFGSAQAKPSTIRCSCQASGRRECASSLSAVSPRGWCPSRMACVISGAR